MEGQMEKLSLEGGAGEKVLFSVHDGIPGARLPSPQTPETTAARMDTNEQINCPKVEKRSN